MPRKAKERIAPPNTPPFVEVVKVEDLKPKEKEDATMSPVMHVEQAKNVLVAYILNRWRLAKTPNERRLVFVLCGEPNAGKTTFARNISTILQREQKAFSQDLLRGFSPTENDPEGLRMLVGEVKDFDDLDRIIHRSFKEFEPYYAAWFVQQPFHFPTRQVQRAQIEDAILLYKDFTYGLTLGILSSRSAQSIVQVATTVDACIVNPDARIKA